MKTKLLLLFAGILFSMSLHAQSTVDIIAPPAKVNASSNVDIRVDYTKDAAITRGHIFVRFKDASGNLTNANKIITASSGSEVLSLPIPDVPVGNTYSYQVQMFNPDDNYAELDTKNYNGVTVEAAVAAPYSITPVTFPTTVTALSSVDVTFDFVKDPAISRGHIFIRLKDATGNLSDVNQIVTVASGTLTLSLPIPDVALGANYFYQVQMFDPDDGYKNYVSVNLPDVVTVEAAIPPANFIKLINPPTSVQAGTFVDLTFDYATDVANAGLFIRLKDAGNLTQVNKTVVAGSGTLTLSLEIPSDALGTGYSFQTQIFDIDDGYKNYFSENITGITVTDPPKNTVTILNPPSPVLINSTVDVTVDYKKEASIAEVYVLVRFKDASGNLEQKFALVTDNSGSVVLSLPTPTTAGTDYSYQAQLYSNDFGIVYDSKDYANITAATTLSTDSFNSSFKNLSIYPNPFTNSFSFKYDDNLNESAKVELFTIIGSKIKTNTTFSNNSGKVDTKNLSKGIYLIRITSGDIQETRRLIKN